MKPDPKPEPPIFLTGARRPDHDKRRVALEAAAYVSGPGARAHEVLKAAEAFLVWLKEDD